MPKIKRLGNRTAAPPPEDLSGDYSLTPDKALSLTVPPKATPFVDRPARMHEWGVAPTSEGPKNLQVDFDPQSPEALSGPDKERPGSYTLAEGQGQFIFGQEGKWQDTVDPANLPRNSSGTAEERREAAGGISGLDSERTRPNVLKEIARNITPIYQYKELIRPPTEVRDPSHVKDMFAESGMPPAHIEAMGIAGTAIKENSRKLSVMNKFLGSGTMGEGKWDRPRDFYDTVNDKLEPDSAINITSRSGFHSGGDATTPTDVLVHESGHALHDMVSGVDALSKPRSVTGIANLNRAFWAGGPRAASGEDPHKEGVADAYRAMYTTPEGPKGADDPEREMGYGIANKAWRDEDPVMKHAYETTRVHTMGGSEPELLGMEPARKGRDPVMGTLQRLVNPDSDYVRTMYGTRKFEGGADLVSEKPPPFDFDAPVVEDTTWGSGGDNSVRWKTAGRDYADNVLSKVQVEPAHLADPGGFRGEQQSLFPEIVPPQDLRENVRELDVENQRSGEDHLNRVKSNLKTWLV